MDDFINFIKYPEEVTNLGNAILYQLHHAGLSRKIGNNEILLITIPPDKLIASFRVESL